jgi:phenylalanyl-tRNA synthetase beta subunit
VKLDEKNQDYSKNNDRYYSFNYSSDLNGISKVLSINVLIGVKMGRISAIIDKERVINEDLKDSLIDLNNYVLLVEGIKRGLQ